jgi:hypothetical protein
MQKILICTNWSMGISGLDEYLAPILNQDIEWIKEEIWINDLFRCNPDVLQAIQDTDYILKKDVYDFSCPYDMEFKIVEIPDNIKWHIQDKECACGEIIVENHKVWG